MARFRKRGLLSIIILSVIVILTGGYFIKRSFNHGMAAKRSSVKGQSAADSTADSTVAGVDSPVEEDDKDKDDKDKKKEPDPVPIEIALVNPRQISSYYYTTATLEPERKVNILAKITGEVTKIHVEEGTVVKAGAFLCQLEGSELKVALDEARINKEQKEREFSRIRSMHEEKLISDKEYSDAKYLHDIAENKYAAAAVRYEYTKIRAPFGGVVTKRYVERGQNLNIGSQVFELADLDPLLIRMYLPENELSDIRIGQIVSIHPDSHPDQAFAGRVVRIAPEVDQRTGTVKVTAETRSSAV
ncbi:MAG: efflux RND transporter periplasmic adaptor subunit, partial [Candidatus Krumholzibacteria bacterium]|nr:efflux RND transporter periplasmic adaptor subunit [Candidatus Krumholzibacteria bacterium]